MATTDISPANPSSTGTREIPLARLTNANHPQYGGRNLLELMWAVIDQEMDTLMSRKTVDSQGFCLGAATMLATFLNPYIPDVTKVRKLALKRWKYRHFQSEEWE
jgi:hypothetical protein